MTCLTNLTSIIHPGSWYVPAIDCHFKLLFPMLYVLTIAGDNGQQTLTNGHDLSVYLLLHE